MKRIGILLSAASLLAFSSAPLFAEEAEHATKGLPQLNAAHYPDLLIGLAICFPLLFVLMRSWIVPSVQTAQGNRRQILDADLAASKAASDGAEAMREESDKALAAAYKAADDMVETILADAAKEAEAKNRALQTDMARKIEETEKKIATMKAKALEESPKAVADIAASIVDTLLSSAKKASV